MEVFALIGLISAILIGICILLGCLIWCCQKSYSDKSYETRSIHDVEKSLPNIPKEFDEPFINQIDLKVIDDKTLYVKSLDRIIPTPQKLYTKHVVRGKITDKSALKLSELRGLDFAKKCNTNSVFEDPTEFCLCSVDEPKVKLNSKTKCVYVAVNPVQTYQCFINNETKWCRAKKLGLKYPIFEHPVNNFHFLRKSLKYNNVIFV